MQNNMGNIQAAQREPAMGGRQAPFFSRLRQMMQRRQPQRQQAMPDQGPASLGQRSMGQAVMDSRQRGFNPASQFKQQASRLDQGMGRGGRF